MIHDQLLNDAEIVIKKAMIPDYSTTKLNIANRCYWFCQLYIAMRSFGSQQEVLRPWLLEDSNNQLVKHIAAL